MASTTGSTEEGTATGNGSGNGSAAAGGTVALDERPANALIGHAPPSPAGPLEPDEVGSLPTPPEIPLAKSLQVLRFSVRQTEFIFKSRRHLGDVFRMNGMVDGRPAVTGHPDHVKSLFTAKPDQVPTLATESPLRPVVGPNSLLTANGPRHMRQRKLLLPPFHGEAIAQYTEMIAEATDREIDRWPIGRAFALAPKMQAITLDVIMAGIFGIEGQPRAGTPEHALRAVIKAVMYSSTLPPAQLAELMNVGKNEPVGLTKHALQILDAPTYAVIRARRKVDDLAERRDILSLIMLAETDDGERLSDQEVRDELLTLVLAGHETTANSLAWTWERLVRFPDAYDRLTEGVRAGGEESEQIVEATINEGMRSRPVIPIIGRRPKLPWRLGDYEVPAETPIAMSVLLIHHREDLYPRPFDFLPERWIGHKPGTYEWIPFGGGTRRCIGAALAMAEQRVVLESMARRLDIEAADPEPERAVHRNVTMIPSRGARVVVRARTAA